jgi:hypothetical protein
LSMLLSSLSLFFNLFLSLFCIAHIFLLRQLERESPLVENYLNDG